MMLGTRTRLTLLVLCLGAGATRAGTYSVTWPGTANSCTVCGTNSYACSSGYPAPLSPRTFVDATPPDTLVTSVTVTLRGSASCGGATVAVSLNGVTVGIPVSSSGACSCGNCGTNKVYTLTNAAGIPGWVYGGTNTLTLSVTGAYCSTGATVTTTETALAPGLHALPAVQRLPNQRVGTTGAPVGVALKVVGDAPVTVLASGTSGPFGLAGLTTPLTLDGGSTTPFGVTFSPTAPGLVTGNASFTSDAPNGPMTTLALSGVGIEPRVTLSPGTLNFSAPQPLGTNSTALNVTVSNPGTDTLAIASITPAGPFQTSGLPTPASIDAGTSASFQVTFLPVTEGPVMGTVTVASDAANAPSATVNLTGTGVAPALTATPASVDFGTQRVATTSTAHTVSLVNTGTSGSVVISAVTVTGPFARNAGALPATVGVGGTRPVSVTFTPTAVGAVSGSLTVTTNLATSPLVIPLSGAGVQPAISVSPSALAFGGQRVGSASAPLDLLVSNPGGFALTVSGVALSGANAGDFALAPPPTLPLTITAGADATLRVTCHPTVRGARAATLTLTSNAAGMATTPVPLSCTGQAPVATVTPTSLTFGAVSLGSDASLLITVGNTGDADLRVDTLTFSGTEAQDFSSPFAVPGSVAPGASSLVPVRFAPGDLGARAGVLTLLTDDLVTPSRTVTLGGTGTAPRLFVSLSQHAFGQVRVGASASIPLTLRNDGTEPLLVSALSLSGAGAAAFQLAGASAPLTLAPGASQPLTLAFTPPSSGPWAGRLELASDDPLTPTRQVALTGEGVQPVVSLAPATLDFGGQLVGRASAPRLVTLTNTGSAPLSLSALTLTGPASADFSLVTAPVLPTTVAVGASLSLEVTLTAAAVGARSAMLNVQSDDPSSPSTGLAVSGLGLDALLSASPASLDFGVHRVGAAAAALPVTISNLGGDALTLRDAATTGAGASAFQTGAVAGLLAPGTARELLVTFSPPEEGSFAAAIALTADDPSVPALPVPVVGHGAVVRLRFEPTSVDFGDVAIGATTSPVTVTLANDSTGSVNLASVAANAPEVTLTGSDVSFPLAAGALRTLTLTFSPSRAGAWSGELAATVAGSEGPEAVVALSARGVAGDTGGGAGGGGPGAPPGGCGCGAPGALPILPILVSLLALGQRRRQVAVRRGA